MTDKKLSKGHLARIEQKLTDRIQAAINAYEKAGGWEVGTLTVTCGANDDGEYMEFTIYKKE